MYIAIVSALLKDGFTRVLFFVVVGNVLFKDGVTWLFMYIAIVSALLKDGFTRVLFFVVVGNVLFKDDVTWLFMYIAIVSALLKVGLSINVPSKNQIFPIILTNGFFFFK